jgi:ABC-type cobalamin/Fe3+-siderophores transport system ATPase subunit
MTDLFDVLYNDGNTKPNKGQVILRTGGIGGWNDFGFHTSLVIKYLDSEGILKSRTVMFGLLNGPENKIEHPQALKAMFETDVSDKDQRELKFFVMMKSLSGYREIVKDLGITDARRLLLSINDLVVYKGSGEDWHTEVLNTEVFKRAFVRNSDHFFTYHNADSVLNENIKEDFTALSSDLEVNFKLNSFQSKHKVRFKFDAKRIVPKRINILIGKNGLGKSQTLIKFTESLLNVNSVEDELRVDEDKSLRPMVNRLVVLETPGETGAGFPDVDIDNQELYYRRLGFNGNYPGVGTLGEELVKLIRNDEFIGEKERWDIFVEAISGILPLESLVIKLANDSVKHVKRIGKNFGEQDNLDNWSEAATAKSVFIENEGSLFPLSSGQLTFLKLSVLIANYIENGTYIIIDEPETHLHPQYISKFVELLDTFLEHTGSFSIIATHSPYIVREMTRDQVHLYKEESPGNVAITNPRLRTFGADIDSISQMVFEEDSSSHLTDKIYKLYAEKSFSELDDELGEELSIAALMDLKRRMVVS